MLRYTLIKTGIFSPFLDFQVFLVHSGGPFFKKTVKRVWSVPKGETNDRGEDLLLAVAVCQ